MAVIDEYQPQAMVFNMGRPTIRWVGNEDGLAADPCHYVVEETGVSIYDDGSTALEGVRYLPPECDVAIRRHWFWQPDDVHTLKSREHLLAIWYRSVGLGANLLLNVPPDRRGLIDPADRTRLLETTGELARRFADPVHAELTTESGEVIARFAIPVVLDHLELREDLGSGQRVRAHRVRADGRTLASGHTVGGRRLHAFAPVTVHELRVELTGEDAALSAVIGYSTGHASIPALEEQPAFMADKIDDQHLAG